MADTKTKLTPDTNMPTNTARDDFDQFTNLQNVNEADLSAYDMSTFENASALDSLGALGSLVTGDVPIENIGLQNITETQGIALEGDLELNTFTPSHITRDTPDVILDSTIQRPDDATSEVSAPLPRCILQTYMTHLTPVT